MDTFANLAALKNLPIIQHKIYSANRNYLMRKKKENVSTNGANLTHFDLNPLIDCVSKENYRCFKVRPSI